MGGDGGASIVHPVSLSALTSPMTLIHDPENDPLALKLTIEPFADVETWNEVLALEPEPLVVALRTK